MFPNSLCLDASFNMVRLSRDNRWSRSHYILPYKNIKRHTAHTIVSWPNPKQQIIIHISDQMMITRQSLYSLNHHKGNRQTENTQPTIKNINENVIYDTWASISKSMTLSDMWEVLRMSCYTSIINKQSYAVTTQWYVLSLSNRLNVGYRIFHHVPYLPGMYIKIRILTNAYH